MDSKKKAYFFDLCYTIAQGGVGPAVHNQGLGS